MRAKRLRGKVSIIARSGADIMKRVLVAVLALGTVLVVVGMGKVPMERSSDSRVRNLLGSGSVLMMVRL